MTVTKETVMEQYVLALEKENKAKSREISVLYTQIKGLRGNTLRKYDLVNADVQTQPIDEAIVPITQAQSTKGQQGQESIQQRRFKIQKTLGIKQGIKETTKNEDNMKQNEKMQMEDLNINQKKDQSKTKEIKILEQNYESQKNKCIQKQNKIIVMNDQLQNQNQSKHKRNIVRSKQYQQLQQHISYIQNQNQLLYQQINELQSSNVELKSQLTEQRNKNSLYCQKWSQLRNENSQLKQENERLRQEIEEGNDELKIGRLQLAQLHTQVGKLATQNNEFIQQLMQGTQRKLVQEKNCNYQKKISLHSTQTEAFPFDENAEPTQSKIFRSPLSQINENGLVRLDQQIFQLKQRNKQIQKNLSIRRKF